MDLEQWKQTPPEYPPDFPELLDTLTRIGAPTGAEKRRADFIEFWIQTETGLSCERDSVGNVWVDLSEGASGIYLLDAHIDIVFSDETLDIVKEGDCWHAPGIFDNTVCCVHLMFLLRELSRIKRPLPFMISFTVGEEGRGDLCGIREIVRSHGSRLAEVCAFDLDLERVVVEAVGSVRWKITFRGKGGHSWGDFGTSSAIHVAAEWVHSLAGRFSWESRVNSYNVGVIQGGTGVNAIAETTELLLDLRSVEAESLKQRAAAIEEDLRGVDGRNGMRVTFERIGYRPAGKTPRDSKILAALNAVSGELGLMAQEEVSSTNANAPLDAGIPAVCTGLANGKGIHTREEFLYLSSTRPGWQKLCRMVAELALPSAGK